MRHLEKLTAFFSRTFPIWMLALSALAFMVPNPFLNITPWIPTLLGIVMFGMGLTLTANDFKAVLTHPLEVLLGIFAQYSLMPVIAYGLCVAFDLPKELAVGVILVGACPGGTSSNVLTFIAKGDVALSVTLTSCTTLLSPFITPALMAVLAQEWVDINAPAMFWSILQIVLLPVALGVVIRSAFGTKIERFSNTMPLVSILTIILIVATVVAGAREALAASAPLIFMIVVLHNGFGLVFGYWMAYSFGFTLPKRKCLAIEVGTQNAGLGATLAAVHFAVAPLVAIPSAIFSFWNIIAGAIAASFFQSLSEEEKDKKTTSTHPAEI